MYFGFQRIILKCSLIFNGVLFLFLIHPLIFLETYSATITKANNATNLNVGGSWTGGVAPGANDIASWTSTVAAANSTLLGANQSWRGLSLVSPGGLVTIGVGNTLTLGYSGITMSAATQNLTISSGLSLLGNSSQTWNVTGGRTLTLNTGTFTRSSGASLNVQGAGTVATTNISNTNGIIGPWASFGTGASTQYATVSGGNIAGLTGTAAATAANVTDNTGTLNYDLATEGALGTGVSVNTIRYTGGAGTLSGSFMANGLMNAGTGLLTVDGNIAMGSTAEFVLNAANNQITSSGVISGTGSLIKTGSNNVILSGANTYDGPSVFNGGTITINTLGNVNGGASSLGNASSAGNGTVYLQDATLIYTGGATSTNRIFNFSGTASTLSHQGTGALSLTNAISFNMASTFQILSSQDLTITGLITGSSANGSFYNFSGEKTLTISNANNSFSGQVTIQRGNLNISSIADSGSNCDIGSGTRISFGSAGNNLTSRLQFTGLLGGSSNRLITIASGPTSGGATIENTVSGQMLTLSGALTAVGNATNNANLTLDGVGNITMSGSMNCTTNLLNITKTGTGSAILSGTNTNMGATTVSGGILQFKNQVSLYNNTSASWTAANIIVNSGGTLGLNVGGAGEFTSGDLNTILAIGTAGGGLGSGSFVALDTTNAGGSFTYNTAITNTNGGANVIGLNKIGSGTLILGGSSTYSGGTTITTGTLRAGAVNALSSSSAVSLANTAGATLDLNNLSNSIGSLSGGGTTGGNVTLGSATLTTGGDNTSSNYAGVISGTGGVTKTGTGTQTFTGTNTATGLLTLSNGTAVIGTASGGSWAGSVLANSGSILKGRGTIGGDVTIASGATYAPGNSPGIQSILGNLTLASGSRTEIEIGGANPGNGAGFHDQINATGTVTIQGGTIAPMTIFSGSSLYLPTVGQRFAAITGSSITGTFSEIDNSANPSWVSFIPEYTATVVYLRTTASEFANNPLLGLSGNESAVGGALDSFRPATIVTGAGASDADRIYNALTLLNNGGVKSAIAQMNPEILQEAPKLSQTISRGVHAQVTRQVELRRDFNPAQGGLSIYDRNGQTVYEPVASNELGGFLFQKRKIDKLSFFASIQGEQGEVKPSQTRTDFEYWSASAVYGGNYVLSSDWNLGLFAGYGHSDTSLGGPGGKIGYNGGSFGGYVGWNHADWFVQLSSSIGKGFYETRRNLSFLSEQARGENEGWESTTELRKGKDLSFGKWTLSPSVYGRYSRTFLDAYDESGSAARLHIGAMDHQSAVSGAGVILQRLFPMGKMSLSPRVFVNYEREWIRSDEIRASFAAGGGVFQVSSDPIDADQLTTGLGASWMISPELQIDLSMEAETLQNDLHRRAVNLNCKFSF